MSRNFRPLLPDFGMNQEIKCYGCGQWVSNVDYDSMACRACFDAVEHPGMKAWWLALTWFVVYALGFATYYGIYRLITFLY